MHCHEIIEHFRNLLGDSSVFARFGASAKRSISTEVPTDFQQSDFRLLDEPLPKQAKCFFWNIDEDDTSDVDALLEEAAFSGYLRHLVNDCGYSLVVDDEVKSLCIDIEGLLR